MIPTRGDFQWESSVANEMIRMRVGFGQPAVLGTEWLGGE
jgi:hypothetical protein